MCCTRLAENTRCKKSQKKSPSVHHRATLSGYISATKACINNRKNLLKQQYLPHMSLQYGAAEIGSLVSGTPADFNGFRVLASLLQWCRSTEVNQSLHNVWSSPGLVHYIYIFGDCCPLMEFCQVQNSLCVQVLHSPILAVLLHGICSTAFNRRRHLYIQECGHHVGHLPAI